MLRCTNRIHDDHRGATAIEYALIGGLIGLGLIGSLVATRTSLTGTLNAASAQMGSASTPAAAQPVSTRTAYWQAKTLTATTVSGNATLYQYGDGTQMSVTKRFNADGSFAGLTMTETGKIYDVTGLVTYKTDAAGALTDYYYEEYYSGTSQKDLAWTTSASKNWVIDGIGYNPNGSVGYTSHPTLPASYVNQGVQDVLYFTALGAS